MVAILNFCQKVAKHKSASISLNVRAISSKFSIPGVSKQYAMLTFGKFSKNGSHFEFWNLEIVTKNANILEKKKFLKSNISFIAMSW